MAAGVTGPVVFALLAAALALVLVVVAARGRRWLEVGISAAATLLLVYLGYLASLHDIPLWGVLLSAWTAAGLLLAAGWSLIRGVEKARTGEETR